MTAKASTRSSGFKNRDWEDTGVCEIQFKISNQPRRKKDGFYDLRKSSSKASENGKIADLSATNFCDI
jgi:hypothetical protein